VLVACVASYVSAQTGGTSLTYVAGSSVKREQINGDCDWTAWDATINNKTPTCKPTVSQTTTKADVLGNDVGSSFEHNGELIFTFGDTIGASTNFSKWTSVQNPFAWQAHDPIARSTTQHAEDGLLLNFFLSGNHALTIEPPPQQTGFYPTPVNMGADNVPEAGISLDGQIYLFLKTGSVTDGAGNNDGSHSYTLIAKFDETAQTFTAGRTISQLPGGRFIGVAAYEAPAGLLGTPPPTQPEPLVVMFGLSTYRASNVYLSVIPKSQFESGVDSTGKSATRYFAGLTQGKPVWSANETDAMPTVTDLDPANPTIGNVSAFYSQDLGLWLMTYDGGRGAVDTTGVYFTYAAQPWGPWAKPQLVFNDCRDKGFGNFVFYYYATAAANNCPSAMPAGVTAAPGFAGPSGPMIGVNDPATTRGGAYAPLLVQRFTNIDSNTLEIYYTLSTWNPYAVVMMESDFTISHLPAISQVANAEGESPTIAPNTWVEIKGSNLAPTGFSSPDCAPGYCWQGSDFVGSKLPAQLDGVGATVNGKNAFVYYISPGQINILTPPDSISGSVQVQVNSGGVTSASFTAQAAAIAPSFFVFNGGPYLAATHVGGALIGPATLFPKLTTPAKPNETIVLYANGFGPTSTPVVSGSVSQSGTLSPLPVVKIGGVSANVTFAGLVAPGEFQFNVVVPANTPDGDQSIVATYNGSSTQSGTLITIQH
jgi:uncharacterized protein (TIGR03437 family)